jgi:hypothetical protein
VPSSESFSLLTEIGRADADLDLDRVARCWSAIPSGAELAVAARAHGLLPLLGVRLEQAGLRISVRGPDLVDAVRGAKVRNLLLLRELDHVCSILQGAGVHPVPFKGPALSQQLYGDPARRQSADIDILVRSDDALAARRALEVDGYRFWANLTEEEDRRFLLVGNEFGLVGPMGTIVELSWALAPRYVSVALPLRDLLQDARTIHIDGTPYRAFAPHSLLLALCVHGAKHAWERVGWLTDVAQLIRSQPELDLMDVLSRAEAFGVRRMMLSGVALSHRLLMMPLDEGVHREIGRDPQLAHVVDTILGRLRHTATEHRDRPFDPAVLRLRERRGDRIRFVWRLALTPTIEDWKAITLPPRASFLYPIIRPYRLARKYLPSRGRRTT